MDDETRIAPPLAPPPNAGGETALEASAPVTNAETLPHDPDRTAAASFTVAEPGRVAVPGYDLLGELGRGGMGVVYKARQIKLNRIVALKMILAGGHANASEIARFVAEAEAVAAIRHAHVIQVFDSGEADGHPYMAMEYLEGGSLSQSLRAGGKVSPRAAAELVQKVARGVQAAHDRGIVHRDLKPHNVLLDAPAQGTPEGTWGEPKVMDFGLAKRDGADVTTTGAVLGTPAYMAPEQARGETKAVGRAADVYALGVILYECLSGSVPFQGRDPWSVIRQVISTEPEPVTRRVVGIPRDLDLVCRKCMEKAPCDRYESAAALADDLQRFLTGEPLRGPRTGVWYSARRSARRWWRSIAAVSALLGSILIAWLLPSPLDLFRSKAEPQPEQAAGGKELAKDDAVGTLLRAEVENEVEALRLEQPLPDRVSPHPLERVASLSPTDYSRFKVFDDRRIIDLRGWKPLPPNDPAAECAVVYFTRREMMKLAATNELRIESRTTGRDLVNRAERPNGELARAEATDVPGFVGGQAMKVRHLVFNVANVPINQRFTLRYSSTYWNSLQTPDEQWFGVIGYEGSVKASMLVLFPENRPFREYRLKSAPTNDTSKGTDPQPYAGPRIAIAAPDRTWLYWEVPAPRRNTVYRVDWTW